jgi:hypothetical protein
LYGAAWRGVAHSVVVCGRRRDAGSRLYNTSMRGLWRQM